MKMKRTGTLLMVLFLLWTVIPSVNAASIYKREKKNIYLVMDDSGSMGGSPTNDANYSLQTMLAMTDKNDTVNLYFLNDNSKLGGDMDMSNKSNAMLENVRKKYPRASGGTPYGIVEVAQQDLRDAAYQGDETDHWLIVLTDGSFDEDDTVGPNSYTATDLVNFSEEVLANGTHPNVLFISIGGYSCLPSTSNPTLHYIEEFDIKEAMNQAVRLISGRVEVAGSYSQDKTQVTFKVPYPAKNIVVFTQNIKTQITDVVAASELDVSENYTVTYPENNAKLKDSTVCFIPEKNGSSISMGDVTLTFDKALKPGDTTILIEPAIALVAHYYNQDGQEVDPLDLSVGEKAKLTYSLCDSETKQPLDPAVLGGGVTYSAEIDGQTYQNTDQIDFEVTGDTLDVKIFATLPDGYELDIYGKYMGLQKKRFINFSLANGGRFSADYDQLKNAPGVDANVMINGRPLTEEQFKDFSIRIKGENGFISNFSVEKDTVNGKFVIHPKKGWISVLTPKAKTYTVVLTDKEGGTYTANMTVEIPGRRPWIEILIFLAILALVIYFIVVFATKKYFPRGVVFLFYATGKPTARDAKRPKKITLGGLFWNEFKQIFKKGNFIIFKHLLVQLLPHQAVCVGIYDIYSGCNYSDITLYAQDTYTVQYDDRTLRENRNGHGYTSAGNYHVLDSNFSTEIVAENMLQLGEKRRRPRRIMAMEQVLMKKTKLNGGDTYFRYYLQMTKKRKKNHY